MTATPTITLLSRFAVVAALGLALSAPAPAATRKAAKPARKPAVPTLQMPSFGDGLGSGLALPPTLGAATPQAEDYIVTIVGKEVVTNSEVRARVARIEQDAARTQASLPPRDMLVAQVLELLISERAQLLFARESGMRVDDAEIDRAVQGVASQNHLTVAQLSQQLRKEGLDMPRLRANLRDQLLLERVRDREVQSRVRITDAEVDEAVAAERQARTAQPQLNIAHLLVAVPETAKPAEVEAAAQRARQLLARARGGESFEALARDHSDASKDAGGALGLRPAQRLPEPFVAAVADLRPGEVSPQLLRSDAGFHIIRLVERKAVDAAPTLTQTHARHILLRTSARLSADAAAQKLRTLRQQVIDGRASFAQLARENSEDGSAPAGGDLGWSSAGQFVPEFEEALNALQPGQVSEPVVSRFGVHLIQLMERREVTMTPAQIRDAARARLRTDKSEQAFQDWMQEVRARAYVEMREAPSVP